MLTLLIPSFASMEAKLPIKNLVRLNWFSAIVISALIYVYLQFNNEEPYLILYTVMTLLNIAIIGYLNIYLLIMLIPRFGKKTLKFRIYQYSLSYILSFLVYLLIFPIFATIAHEEWSPGDLKLFLTFLVSSALVNTLVVIFQGFIVLQSEKATTDLEVSRLKIAHAEAANMLLKQQIHPHFLFNALNTLKSLYRTNTDSGDKYLVHLANFLRASIYSHNTEVASLQEELNLLKNYLEMQTIRFGSGLNFAMNIPEESLKKFYLPSFSLQPLLENAIKHNEMTPNLPLEVTITQHGGRLIISNNLQPKKNVEISTNSGLSNLAERYRIWSGDEVIISNANNKFTVSIKLLENEYRSY